MQAGQLCDHFLAQLLPVVGTHSRQRMAGYTAVNHAFIAGKRIQLVRRTHQRGCIGGDPQTGKAAHPRLRCCGHERLRLANWLDNSTGGVSDINRDDARSAYLQGQVHPIKIAQVAKTGLFASTIEVLGPLGYDISVAAYWHKNFPYKSTLTGVTGVQLAEGYEKASGKQWNQQLGASLSLLDVGFAALKNTSNPKDKAALAKSIATLKTTTMMGKVDFTSGPVPNVSPTNMIGAQWVKAPAGSKFKYDYVLTENASDASIPIARKVVPYGS